MSERTKRTVQKIAATVVTAPVVVAVVVARMLGANGKRG